MFISHGLRRHDLDASRVESRRCRRRGGDKGIHGPVDDARRLDFRVIVVGDRHCHIIIIIIVVVDPVMALLGGTWGWNINDVIHSHVHFVVVVVIEIPDKVIGIANHFRGGRGFGGGGMCSCLGRHGIAGIFLAILFV